MMVAAPIPARMSSEDRVVPLLRRHSGALDRLAGVLREQETVDGSAVLNSLRDQQSAPDTDGDGDVRPVAPVAGQENDVLSQSPIKGA